MKPANYAPVYCAIYPAVAEIVRQHGYAMAIHGSLARDADFICIPWVESPSLPETVVQAITEKFAIRQIGEADLKAHGRLAYSISIGWGECALDLSFMPFRRPLGPGEDPRLFSGDSVEGNLQVALERERRNHRVTEDKFIDPLRAAGWRCGDESVAEFLSRIANAQ